ncbi:S-layer homology domain-containing protein [Paenibacillus sp. 598K]|uniref:S-layer homology domain-containing protein n=1 Tax=Paenibacillus sp. 598K TaxID=1117987 RepID=UPI000FFE5BD6|nr:S-layer homology domain-containing protein [Paenibacillus sp. 598K]
MSVTRRVLPLLLAVLLATGVLGPAAGYASAEPEEPLLEAISIGRFDTGSEGWSAYMDAYPSGGFQRDPVPFATAGNRAVKLPGDFSSGHKNGAIARALPGEDFYKVSFRLKTTDVDRIYTRLIDGSGQTFQQQIAVTPDNQWQTIVIDELTAGEHWGGAGDGSWHSTAWALQIMTDTDFVTNHPSGEPIEVLVDDVQLYVADPAGERTIPIGQFDAGDDGWSASMISYQSGYQEDAYILETIDADGGQRAAKLPGDFSGSYQNSLISKSLPGLDIRKVSFKVKTLDVNRVLTRLIDATGQTFQQLLPVVPDGQWHTVTIDELGLGDSWGGAGDGSWHGVAQSLQIMADKSYIVKSPNDGHVEVLIDDVQLYIDKQAEVTLEHLLDDFEQPSDWYYGYGDSPGVIGSYTRTDADAYEGDYSGKLSADFSAGSQYVTMYTPIYDGLDVEKLAFRIKTSAYQKVKVRTVDTTGQIFQHEYPLLPTGEWQQVVVDQMASAASWHGAADGVWHGPIKGFYILLDQADLIDVGAGVGEAYIDQVTASEQPVDFQIMQRTLGHIYLNDQTVQFDLQAPGDQVAWQVTDYWGRVVRSGSKPVADGIANLTLQSLDNGYYLLDVVAYSGGVKLGTRSASFAVLDEAIDLHTVTDSPFGIATHFDLGWSPSLIPLIQKAGIKHIRDEMRWSDVELTAGVYEFRTKYDQYMNQIQALGIDLLLVLSYMNPNYDGGYTPYTPAGREAFARYATAILEHYPDQIKQVEVYNEYNIGFSSGPGAQDPAYYFQLLKETYNQVKAYDNEVSVIGPVTSQIPWEWLKTLFAQADLDGKALDYMDAVSVHPYRYPGSPEGMDQDIVNLQQLVQDYNDNEPKPIFISEWGWPTHQGLTGTSEAMQAAYLVRSSVQMLSQGVERLVWYDFKNDGIDVHEPEHNFGILRNESDPLGKYAPKPAYVAYANLTRALTGADFVEAEEIGAGIYSYLFERGSEQIRVMWSPGGAYVTLDTDTAASVTDVVGRDTTLTPYEGQVAVKLTEYPVFVRGAIDEIETGGPFAITSAEQSISGEDIALTLVVDNSSSAQPLTAQFVIRGESYEVSAPAGQRVEQAVSVPDATAADQTITLSGEVYVASQRMALVSTTLRMIDPLSIHAFHTIQDAQDVIRLEITNHAATDFLLERAEWSLDGNDQTTTMNQTLAASATTVRDIPLTALTPGSYEYELELFIASYPTWRKSWDLKLVDHAQLTPIDRQSIPNTDDSYVFPTPATVDLAQDGDFQHLASYSGASDLSGDIWLNWDDDNFYLSAEISDDAHVQPSADREIWQGDSIQFALSPGAPGEDSRHYEYGIALTSQGPQLYRWSGMTAATIQQITNRELRVVRDETNHKTRYKLALPWSELAPIKPSDVLFSFSMLVNDNDGAGRRGWAEWGAGIGSSKDTKLYRAMTFAGAAPTEEPEENGGTTSPPEQRTIAYAALPSKDGKATIAAGGSGTASLRDLIEVIVPAGASKTALQLLIREAAAPSRPALPQQLELVGEMYEITKDAAGKFERPVTLRFALDPAETAGRSLAIYYYDETAQTWVELGGTVSDGFISVEVDHFTTFAVLATSAVEDEQDEGQDEGPSGSELAGRLTDIAGHWAAEPIREAARQGIVTGYTDGTFRPDAQVTRTEYAAMLARALRLPADEAALRFADADQIPAWAQEAVAAAASSGLLRGNADHTFAPDRPISRAEMAVIVARAAGISADSVETAVATPYADDAAIAPWARGAISAVAAAGLMSGRGEQRFAPHDQATRAEAVVVLLRLLAYVD